MTRPRQAIPRSFYYEPLTPVSLLRRSSRVWEHRRAVMDGRRVWTYGELWNRASRAAGMLAALGVAPGDRVAVLSPNTHVMLEAHFAVPMAGAVLVTLNIRLTPRELGYMIAHSEARVLICDADLEDLGRVACAHLAVAPTVVVAGADDTDYERGLDSSCPLVVGIDDELDLLAINYTSGTTGTPKGVMYHHRGAYLQALAQVVHMRLTTTSVFLWTLPMFHCNGWTYPWAVVAAGGLQICMRQLNPAEVWRHIRQSGVTHFMGAPTVLTMVTSHQAAMDGPCPRPVLVGTGGAPPGPALLERAAQLGFAVTHLYGLTETFGPIAICDWDPDWDEEPAAGRAALLARQGVGNLVAEPLSVVGEDGSNVIADGVSLGEIMVRGNNVMLGYYRDELAAREAISDGWLRTGDVAVVHADGYVEVRDRAKDVIISGGENISSIEVEHAITSHPAVSEAAVVGRADEKWGEVPVAFVTVHDGVAVTAEEIRAHLAELLAKFKVPREVFFGPLPKTATGKIQKFALRAAAGSPSIYRQWTGT